MSEPRRYRTRPADGADAAALSRLSGELGDPVEPAVLAARLAAVAGGPAEAVFVAERSADVRVVGWIHVCAVRSLETEPFAEIRGLIVDRECRRAGIGAALVAAAAAWARGRGLRALRVRTNVVREDARKFYSGAGFKLVKTQDVYALALG
jgi:GNAT superfamily N-acetyltransferase